jgi:hypothetical protein
VWRAWLFLTWLVSPLVWLLRACTQPLLLAVSWRRRARHDSDTTPPPDPVAGAWSSEVRLIHEVRV